MSRRLLAIAAAATLATTVWAVAPSSAGAPQMSITPEEGPPGTVISVTGANCTDSEGITAVDVALFDDIDSSRPDATTATPDADGNWSATLTVPADTEDYGDWRVSAQCVIPAQEAELFEYPSAAFTVLAPTPAPPTTAAPEAPPATAPAAAPVAATPDFTG